MPNLSDIKLMTQTEMENLVTSQENTANYLYEGWGSKFGLQDFVQTLNTEGGLHRPETGNIGFETVTTLKIQPIKTVSLASLHAGDPIEPDTGYDVIAKVIIE